jgi:hypothetical protein
MPGKTERAEFGEGLVLDVGVLMLNDAGPPTSHHRVTFRQPRDVGSRAQPLTDNQVVGDGDRAPHHASPPRAPRAPGPPPGAQEDAPA